MRKANRMTIDTYVQGAQMDKVEGMSGEARDISFGTGKRSKEEGEGLCIHFKTPDHKALSLHITDPKTLAALQKALAAL